MRNQTQAHLLRRTSLWLLGQALPETGALRKPARLAMIGVVVASAAGTLIALSVVAGLVALYYYVQSEGLSSGASLGVVAGVGLMAGIITFLVARSRVDAIPDSMDDLQLFQGRTTDIFGELLQMAVGGFMEGMSDRAESKAEAKAKQTREEIEDAIEALIDKLDSLEAEAEDLGEEVVLDLERHAPRTSRRKP